MSVRLHISVEMRGTNAREREREREREGRGRGGRRRGGADNGTIKRKFYCVIAASFEGEETE